MARVPPSDEPDSEPSAQVDLHGLRPEDALRKLAQELHACRVRRVDRLRVITGRGWGNRLQQPVLRPRVERWLAGSNGARLGVLGFEVASDGGSLVVRLRRDGARRVEHPGELEE